MNSVSVIIPTYKRSKRLSQAIDSVLKQTYKNIEIIVVDDNGINRFQKDTKEVLKPYIEKNQINYICHNTNLGGCKARNTGAFAAKGEYISFLDDDDFYEPSKIEEQINFIENNKKLDACICSMYRIDENNVKIESRENIARGKTLKEAILDGNLFTSMLLIKKSVFIKLEGFSEIPRFQDKYFHYKFLSAGYKIDILNKQLLTLVEHSESRISSLSAKKIITSLNLLTQFENNHNHLFSENEGYYIKYRHLIKKVEVLCAGKYSDKLKSLLYCFKSIKYASKKNYHYIFKLMLKSLLPNFIIKN
ncbi:glycosyltransferase family 2 protein [Thalassobellus suaedae]|uniref:Glycosyltransferase family 2 protein n=1 Tax=Thalassobellus suaedae TaxID=3074124 RepID=A0ABY9XWX0_9FLAO|nr:glycosyltransferase family 2 protein [Flavobacteriaceae bacterium HL-DH14]